MDGIVEGIRVGNAFLDTAGTRDRKLDLTATHKQATATLGGQLSVPAKQLVTFTIRVEQMAGGTIEAIHDAAVIQLSDSRRRSDSTE